MISQVAVQQVRDCVSRGQLQNAMTILALTELSGKVASIQLDYSRIKKGLETSNDTHQLLIEFGQIGPRILALLPYEGSQNVISNSNINASTVRVGNDVYSAKGVDPHNSHYIRRPYSGNEYLDSQTIGTNHGLEPTTDGPMFHQNSSPYSALVDFVNRPWNPMTPDYAGGIEVMQAVVNALEHMQDLEEEYNEATRLLRAAKRNELVFERWQKFSKELSEIVMAITAPQEDLRTIALKDGSSYEQMVDYINELKATKEITADRAKQLKAIYTSYENSKVGIIRMRMALKALRVFVLLFIASFSLNAQSHLGERFEVPARYYIPPAERVSLHSFSDTTCILQFGPADTFEVCHISLKENVAFIQGSTFQIAYDLATDWQEEYNDETGIRALHGKSYIVNDCGQKYAYEFDMYDRPISKTFYIRYKAYCEGVEVQIGDAKLARAIKWGYVVPKKLPPSKTPR